MRKIIVFLAIALAAILGPAVTANATPVPSSASAQAAADDTNYCIASNFYGTYNLSVYWTGANPYFAQFTFQSGNVVSETPGGDPVGVWWLMQPVRAGKLMRFYFTNGPNAFGGRTVYTVRTLSPGCPSNGAQTTIAGYVIAYDNYDNPQLTGAWHAELQD
jgi:hypothetical protein